jgi:hypothetical protein
MQGTAHVGLTAQVCCWRAQDRICETILDIHAALAPGKPWNASNWQGTRDQDRQDVRDASADSNQCDANGVAGEACANSVMSVVGRAMK